MKPSKFYICGRMTDGGAVGLSEERLRRFYGAEAILKALGHHPVNPARNHVPSEKWVDYMKLGIMQLMFCDAVLLLDGWEEGVGSAIEGNLARDLGIPRCRLSARSVPELINTTTEESK